MIERQNNFDFLRVVAALIVIHGHGWLLSGGPNPGLWGVPFSRIGLDIFFSISGYLVTSSWERSPRLRPFLAKRSLRIFPGLIACVIVTIVVVGPIATALPLDRFFAAEQTRDYLANIALYEQLYLPGVFEGLQEHGAVNGSLWSLLPEFLCYLTVPLFALLGRWREWGLAGAALLSGGMSLYLFNGYAGPAFAFYHLDLKYALAEAPFFFAGGILALLERRIGERMWRVDLCLLFFVTNYGVSSWFDWWNLPLEWLSLPYMVICFGRLSLPVLRRAGRLGDLSFGLYLYAFPIQQLVLVLLPGDRHPVLTTVVLTAPVAFLSWHLVEARALRLKPRAAQPARSTSAERPVGQPSALV